MRHSFFSRAGFLVSKYGHCFQKIKNVSLSLMVFSVISFMLAGVSVSSAVEPAWTTDPDVNQVEGLFRAGPNDPVTGWPLWYEDKNGVKLGICTDLNLCFFAAPDAAQPVIWPTNYPDEVFYFVAESIMSGSPDTGIKAILTQAIEGAFGGGDVLAGDNIVFSRIRIRVDNLVQGRQYKVTYPYGVHVFVAGADAGPGTVAGPGLSMVRDLGISDPMVFTGVLNGDIGPFLTSTDPLPPAPGFISPNLNPQTVTGSPLGTNFFRIEGIGVGLAFGPEYTCADIALGPDPLSFDDCIQSDLFSIQGQFPTQMGVRSNRATFSKEIDPLVGERTYVNIWAESAEGQSLIGSVDGGVAETFSEGLLGNYFLRLEVPNAAANAHPISVLVVNNTDAPPMSDTMDIIDSVNITSATYTIGQGLDILVQSSNQIDAAGGSVVLVSGLDKSRTAALVDTGNGNSSGAYVAALDDLAPLKVVVTSKWGDVTESAVRIKGAVTGGATVALLSANAGPDQSVLGDGTTVILNGSDSLGPIGMTYSWSHDDTTGLIVFTDPLSGQASFNTPHVTIPGGILTVNFTLTVSDGVSTSSDVVSMVITQPSSLPADDCGIASAQYNLNKEKWKIVGTCTVLDNQILEVFLGNDVSPLVYIGQTNVDAVGQWKVRTDTGSAAADGTIPSHLLGHTKVYAISARGGVMPSLGFESK